VNRASVGNGRAADAEEGVSLNPMTEPRTRNGMSRRLGEQVANALEQLMEPHGVAVHLEAVRLCAQMRELRDVLIVRDAE
jgi:hypothetical protein